MLIQDLKDFLGILFSLLFLIVDCKFVLSTGLFFFLMYSTFK